ncbi:MAG: hypothetical protein ABJH04_08155 [Cyclobacteriaceae bacterium]
MKVFKIEVKGIESFFIGQSLEDVTHAVKAYYSFEHDLEYDSVEIKSCKEVKMTPKVLKVMAEQYAKAECSCYTNDFNGFIQGFIACIRLTQPHLVALYEKFVY